MRTIKNIIEETKKLSAESNKSYDFVDGRNTLQIGFKNAKLVDNAVCRDENGMAFKCYAIFELTGDIKSALMETIQEGLEHRMTHNVLIDHARQLVQYLLVLASVKTHISRSQLCMILYQEVEYFTCGMVIIEVSALSWVSL